MFETWFKNLSDSRAAIQSATTEEEREDARLYRRTLRDEIDRSCDDATKHAFSDYCFSRNNGNSLLDVHEVLWSKDVPAYVESLRSHGLQMFTVSSTFGGAVELYWELEKAGCHMVGMREVFTSSYVGDTDEHEKVPAVLFSLY